MSDSKAVVQSEERPAIAYPLRSRAAEILNTPEARAQIVPFIPQGVDFDRVLAEVHRCAVNNPDILKCTPASVIQAVGSAVQTGLVIGKTIHLVPCKTKVGDSYEQRLQAWTDYKGDIELVMWSGAARSINAAAVYEHDQFDYELGDSPWVKHKPVLKSSLRGPIRAGYAIAHLNVSGTLKKLIVLSIDDVEKVRKASRSWSPQKVAECPDWYVEKTCIHRLCKTLPKTRKLAQVLAMFDARESNERGEELDPADEVRPRAFEEPFADVAQASTTQLTRSSAYLFPLPFGSYNKGKAIGDLDPALLRQAYDWAREQTAPEHQYLDFVAAAEALFDERAEQVGKP